MLNAIDHVNIVVRDMGGMVRFYTVVLGMKLTRHVTISGEWIDRVVGLIGVRAEVAYLDPPDGPRVELIRYEHPAAAPTAKAGQANTPGLRHIAFRVKQLDEVAARLRDAGVKMIGDVQQVPDEQVKYAGGVHKRLVYFHDPEGNLLELCEYRGRGSG